MHEGNLGYWLVVVGGTIVFGLAHFIRRAKLLYRVPIHQNAVEHAFVDPILPRAFVDFVSERAAALESLGFHYGTCLRTELIPGRGATFLAVYVHAHRRAHALFCWGGMQLRPSNQPRFTGIDFVTAFEDGFRLTTANTGIGLAASHASSWSVYWFDEQGDPRDLWALHERLCAQRRQKPAPVASEGELRDWLQAGHRQMYDAFVDKRLWYRDLEKHEYVPRARWVLHALLMSVPGVAQVRKWHARRAMRRRAAQLLDTALPQMYN